MSLPKAPKALPPTDFADTGDALEDVTWGNTAPDGLSSDATEADAPEATELQTEASPSTHAELATLASSAFDIVSPGPPAEVGQVRAPLPKAGGADDAPGKAAKKTGNAPSLPKTIGRYDVVRRLGVGGMAEVFLAKQRGPAGFQKTVVVKRSLPHLALNASYTEMFAREARIAARLSHAHIVQIYEFGEDAGSYFLAMEYLDGLTVDRLAKRVWSAGRHLDLNVTAQVVADAALGLHYAHRLKDEAGQPLHLVHRDVSPDNLLVNTEGITKILDFGLAKVAGSLNITQTGEIKGKVPFMAPEQINGAPLDGRADLYSLGVTFYWLLARRRPFGGNNDFVTLQSILDDTPSPPSTYNGAVPRALDELVMALLEKRPADRPADGGEVFDALVPFCAQSRRSTSKLIEEMLQRPPPTKTTTPTSGAWHDAQSQPPTPPAQTTPDPRPAPLLKWAALGAGLFVLGLLIAAVLFKLA